MELSEFTQRFREQFAEPDTIVLEADSRFRDLDSWDSLTGMSVLVMIEDELGIVLETEVFKSLNTPREVFDVARGTSLRP